MSKKLFISQPMSARTDSEIEQVRAAAITSVKQLLGDDVEIVDSYIKDPPRQAKPLWLLGKSIEVLSTADIAYFVKGWEDMRGCRIERLCAQEYGIEIIEEVKT